MEKSISSSSTTKLKPQFTSKYAGFQDFIMKHQNRKGENNTNKEITNTRIGSKEDNIYGGSYSIPQDEYELFLNLYSFHNKFMMRAYSYRSHRNS